MSKKKNAISCDGVVKDFYILDSNFNWKIIFCGMNDDAQLFRSLDNVTLEVPKGKFVGILGRNGAGKSTLLRTIGGVYAPTKGVVAVNGELSSLFEMGGFGNFALTGANYARRYLEIYGVEEKERRKLVKNIQEFSELGDAFNKPIFSYSSGMAARLYFSTATELQSSIYLVDELLSVGDEYFQAKSWKRLRERFTKGASGILVTHDWSAVLKLCEQAAILEGGEITAFGTAEHIVQQYLNLPKPSKEYSEILVDSDTIESTGGSDFSFEFKIDVKKEVALELNYSVEYFRPGYGWELVLLHHDYLPLQSKLGINEFRLTIKEFPLMPGSYYLNLFLRSKDGCIDALKLDSRSWTYGNGIHMKISGKQGAAITKLPWRVTSLEEEYVSA